MLALELLKCDDATGFKIGQASIQRGKRCAIEGRTICIRSMTKILQQFLRLFLGQSVNQPVKLFFHAHNCIVLPWAPTRDTGRDRIQKNS